VNDTNFLKENLIAHRGYHDRKNGIPENSLAAYKRAMDEGFGMEIDLHLLKDGEIVVMHDDSTGRMTGINKKLKECTYEDIKNLRLEETSEKIPTLKEVLKLVNGKVPLLIEFKYDLKAGLLEEAAMKLLKDYKGKFAIQSFNPFSLIWFKKNYPNVPRGQLASDYKGEHLSRIKKYILKNLYTNIITRPDFISYSIAALPNKRVEKYRNSGVLLGGWTIRNKEDFEFSKNNCDFSVCENMNDYL